MSNFKKTKVNKITSVFLSATTAVWLSGAVAFMPMAAAADTVSDLQAQIAALLAQISTLQAQLNTLSGGTGTTCSFTFGTDMSLGDTGTDVLNLQKALNADGVNIASSGAGSPGNETSYFGPLTEAGVVRFQNKYASVILAPLGLINGTGYAGPSTRAKLNALCSTPSVPIVPGDGTGTPTTPVGSGLTVSAGTQPTASLLVQSAARVPFTVVKFTASSDGDVTVNSLTVERTGLGADASLVGVILLDEGGQQIGLAKTLSSLHQAVLTDDFVVKAGQTRTLTIAGNVAADNTARAGQVIFLSLVGVDTSATVNGTLPITGAGHTVNANLVIGTAEISVSSFDPNSSATKEVGTAGYIFAGIRVDAGSAEAITLKSIRWNETGSADAEDIGNLKTYVDGTAYDTVRSGSYYTSTFGNGIVIAKGNSVDAYLKGDILSGSARTIVFDIYKAADIYVVGNTYGYGITPTTGSATTATVSGSQMTAGTPFYDGSHVTVDAGSISVTKANSVSAQNVAENVSDQVLGGFDVEVKGEAVTVSQMDFYFGTPNTGGLASHLTQIKLYNENGVSVAGPTDSGATYVRFTDSVTFPVGKHTYTLKGKYGVAFTNNETVQASTTPSDWTAVGASTGNTITPTPSTAVESNIMTLKAAAVTISVSSLPLAQTVVAGGPFTFANYNFDLTQSGDDLRVNSLKLDYDATGLATNLTNCILYDGTTALNDAVNPTASDDDAQFTFKNSLTLTKGTTKTLALTCDTYATSSLLTSYKWGIAALGSAAQTFTAVGSGQTLSTADTITVNASEGQAITLSTGGSYTVVDDSTPGYALVTPGTSVELLKLKFSATYEDINIKKVAFALTDTASNTAMDLVGSQVTLWDGATQVGVATFVNNGDNATSSLTANFIVPAGSSKTMTVKGTISGISHTAGPLQRSGDLLKVSYDGDDRNATTPQSGGNYGMGVSSGTSLATGSTGKVTPTGVRIMKSYPTLAKIDLSSSEKVLQTKSGATLYKFSVTANSDDVYLYKLTFNVSSSTVSATTSAYGLYAFTDSGFSSADTTFSSGGLLNANSYYNGLGTNAATSKVSVVEVYMDKASATTTYKVPAGTTRWFELRGTVASVESGTGTEYITVRLEGDAAFPTDQATLMLTAATADGDTNDDFIWSPNSTSTTNLITDLDFTNSYGLVGLPGTSMNSETLTSSN